MEQILDFVAESIGDGTLIGSGSAKPAEHWLNTFISMLDELLILIQADMVAEAYPQLETAYQATDGQKRPNDLVTGPVASDVAVLIENLVGSL